MGTIIDLTTPLNKKLSEDELYSRSHYDTEIIRLQSYDNFYSLMDRLRQLDASGQGSRRLLLVWPARGNILESAMEFGRLRGWAERNHYDIAFVIPGNTVKLKMAQEQNIPAFPNLKEAGESDWSLPSKIPDIDENTARLRKLLILKKDLEETEAPRTPFGIRLIFFLLTLLVLGGVFYAVFPQARVEITPYLTRKSISMTLWTDKRLDAPTLAGGIPTSEKRYDLTLTASVPATGVVQTEPGIAVGEIVVRNICDRINASSAGVRVGTAEDFENGINFITLETVTLAPEESRTVRIEAAAGGEAGNLPAGSIQFAEYPKSLCWEVQQPEPTSGGTSGYHPTPTEADISAAQESINAQIREAAAGQLANDPEEPDLIPLGEAVVTAVKSTQAVPEPGYASDTLTMTQTLTVAYETVRKSDMEAIIRGQSSRMRLQIAGLTGYEILSGPSEKNGLTTWNIRADYLVYEPETNEEALQIMLRGKTLPQADAVLNTLDHIKSHKITLLPSSMKHMPFTAQNIRVVIHPAVEVEEP